MKTRFYTILDVGLLPDLWYCRLNKDNQFNRLLNKINV